MEIVQSMPTSLTDINAVDSVADKRTLAHIVHFSVDLQSMHATHKAPLHADTHADLTDVGVTPEVEILSEGNSRKHSLKR
jgi:hypothetical protein